ncbi:lectin BRA-3 [Biomphalaria glabrata]|nr:lectin BRA-3-like [Biomphalaria glabrata]
MYAYYKTDLTYAEAVAMCQCLDSRLYVARNLSKLEFIIQSAVGAGRATWIGLDDIVQEGQFVWIDGQLFDWTYRNNYFIPGRPDDYMQSQDCCVVDLGSRLLDDISCYSQFSFICEKV